jgi:hypothetical protein
MLHPNYSPEDSICAFNHNYKFGLREGVSRKLAMTPSIKTSKVLALKKAACPRCDASLTIFRSENPYIDECGFESYSLKCGACGSALVGIIDPTDDKLLVTVAS